MKDISVFAQEFEGWSSLVGRRNLCLTWEWTSIFCWVYGDHAIEPSSNLDRTREQYSFFRVLTSAKPLQLRDIRPSILLAWGTILCSWICSPLPKTLTLFMTKTCDLPYPIYDLTKNLIPYLWPDPQIYILFWTCFKIVSLVQTIVKGNVHRC